jgi:hypothetical protein
MSDDRSPDLSINWHALAEHLITALDEANVELCALIAPPFDAPGRDKFPSKLNEADREALANALAIIRAARVHAEQITEPL